MWGDNVEFDYGAAPRKIVICPQKPSVEEMKVINRWGPIVVAAMD